MYINQSNLFNVSNVRHILPHVKHTLLIPWPPLRREPKSNSSLNAFNDIHVSDLAVLYSVMALFVLSLVLFALSCIRKPRASTMQS